MLTRPNITDDAIGTCLRDHYALRIAQVDFLPIGADANSAAFQVTTADGAAYFLKLRRGPFKEAAATIPAYLRWQGIKEVMAPLATMAGPPWAWVEGFTVLLYPFFSGTNGFETALSRAQWAAFGASLRAIHTTTLPPDLLVGMPQEDYGPRYRHTVRAYLDAVQHTAYVDPSAVGLAAFFREERDEILRLVNRAEHLAQILRAGSFNQPENADRSGARIEGSAAPASDSQPRAAIQPSAPGSCHAAMVVCHSDLHGGNLLLGANDALVIVDWDDPILAPKERDLMFIGAGIGGIWDQAQEAAWFYAGYGSTAVDPIALAYYRYERIVADLAAYADEIFLEQVSATDRAEGLRQIKGQFPPGSVVEIAHRSWPFPE